MLKRADAAETDDPLLGQFLGFLARDIATHPERLTAVDRGLVKYIKSLTEKARVDLDAPLSKDDE